MSSGTFQKWYMADGVKRIPVREGRIRGTLFLPPDNGLFPGTSQSCLDHWTRTVSNMKMTWVLVIPFRTTWVAAI